MVPGPAMSFFEQTQLEDLFTGFQYREPLWCFDDKEFYLVKGDLVYPSFDNDNWAVVFPFLFKKGGIPYKHTTAKMSKDMFRIVLKQRSSFLFEHRYWLLKDNIIFDVKDFRYQHSDDIKEISAVCVCWGLPKKAREFAMEHRHPYFWEKEALKLFSKG